MQTHADAGIPAAAITAPSSPTRRLICRAGADDDDDGGGSGHLFFFSAPASPVHYILRSPPSSTTTAAAAHYAAPAAADVGDFEFAGEGAAAMSSAEELFVAGRIRVGCLSPMRQEAGFGEPDQEEDCVDGDGDGERPRPRRARSASPPRSPHHLSKITEPSGSFTSSSSSSSASSSSSSSSSSAKNTRRRISLRDLLLGGATNDTSSSSAAAAGGGERSSGFWPPSIWRPSSSRSTKKTTATLALPCPCPAPQTARRSTWSERSSSAAPRRRTTSLPYRQGLVLGCLGFGARSYGLPSQCIRFPNVKSVNTKTRLRRGTMKSPRFFGS